jgi:hypothetical protein
MTVPSITTRAAKGTALTHAEMDSNLTNLQSPNVVIKAGSTTGYMSTLYDLSIANTATIGASISANTLSLTSFVNYTFSNTATATLYNVSGNVYAAIPGTTFTGGSGSTTINPGATLSIANSTSIGSIVSGTTITFYDLNPGVNLGAGGVSLDSQRGFSIANTATVGASLSSNIFSISAITVGTAGTYQGAVTTDVYGRVTGGTNGFTANVNANGQYIEYPIFNAYREKVAAHATTSGTITIDANVASIQTITTTGNLTINAANMTNFGSGESVTLLLRHNANNRSISSDLLFVNQTKTIGGHTSCVDAISIFFDGTNYLASTVKYQA